MSGGMTQTAHDEMTTAHAPRAARAHDATRRRLFVMRSGARLFAVYADEVEATGENLTPTPLPFAPPPVRGLVSQRGRILTLIDPLPLLPPVTPHAPTTGTTTDAQTSAQTSAPTDTTTAPLPFVVALKGDEQLALSVESIEHEVELYDDEAEAATDDEASDATGASLSPLLRRTIRYHAHAVALLDPARLFDAAMQGVDRRRRRT
ncbi:MAG: CheW-like domain [Pyrinomonadaceae bacterium]|jgi:chemotaxis signal transduction protein|nr:CheW-like domain [Pyrinomonadaceae bacterium]